ncbi:MAG: hypothetical protein BM557_07810 [Flavobacterium sp. MedPE-SWcel]|mgnify:CR=1 FL=1|uniref:DUF2147 domain-containing protein n=1 Tax=uncultured Flavobacterium sp. TaxID=165435 RepID=UPI0009201610|nr:DUF2147 domain-containing protein [uncultured Flavobacterium sp.]OIQ18113.1 MAG: hypothetical protein BM557_07810 [Flavobacterium sp. MedPE-SWcel]
MNTIHKYIGILVLIITLQSCAQTDTIVGVWEVKNDYYQGVFEIVEYEDKFSGKIHYYNDGSTEYKGNNKKEDYFLTDIEFKDGKYINGKMYLPDGSFYHVIFSLKGKDKLEVLMTIEDSPYKETWTRNTSY